MSGISTRYDERTKSLLKLIGQLLGRHSAWQVFSDFLELAAISISNVVDRLHYAKRETQYMETIKRYSKEEIDLFPQMIAALILALEQCVQDGHLEDVLGRVYHELELHNKYHGQFFTPQSVADMMGMIAGGDKELPEKGYRTVCEPCIGSGVMVLGLANAFDKNKAQMVVTGVDIDLKCVHMAYLQLSLYGIPAVIIHGNTLTCEEWSRWYTPVYIVDGWLFREPCGITTSGGAEADERLKRLLGPMYAAFRMLDSVREISPAESQEIPPEVEPGQIYVTNRRGQMSLF